MTKPIPGFITNTHLLVGYPLDQLKFQSGTGRCPNAMLVRVKCILNYKTVHFFKTEYAIGDHRD